MFTDKYISVLGNIQKLDSKIKLPTPSHLNIGNYIFPEYAFSFVFSKNNFLYWTAQLIVYGIVASV